MLKHPHITLRRGKRELTLLSTLIHVQYHPKSNFNSVALCVNFLNVLNRSMKYYNVFSSTYLLVACIIQIESYALNAVVFLISFQCHF